MRLAQSPGGLRRRPRGAGQGAAPRPAAMSRRTPAPAQLGASERRRGGASARLTSSCAKSRRRSAGRGRRTPRPGPSAPRSSGRRAPPRRPRRVADVAPAGGPQARTGAQVADRAPPSRPARPLLRRAPTSVQSGRGPLSRLALSTPLARPCDASTADRGTAAPKPPPTPHPKPPLPRPAGCPLYIYHEFSHTLAPSAAARADEAAAAGPRSYFGHAEVARELEIELAPRPRAEMPDAPRAAGACGAGGAARARARAAPPRWRQSFVC